MTILHTVRVPLTDASQLQVTAFDHGRAIISGDGENHSWSSYVPIAQCREYGAALIAAALDAERNRVLAVEKAEADRVRAAKKAADDQAAAIEAERKRVADEAALAKKQADDRAANVAHRSQRMKAAKDALIDLGLTEDQAKSVVKAIVAGGIPHVSMEF